MRKLLLTVLFLFVLTGAVYAEDTSVRSMYTDCTVAQDGSCTVVITAEIDFAPGTRSFAIPISADGRDVTVTGYTFDRERSGDYALLHLNSETGFSGTQSVTVSYHLAETVVDKGETQDFFVTLLYPAWTCPIESYHIHLKLPESFDSLPTILSGYYGDLIDNYMDVRIDDGEIDAVLNNRQRLQDHESMSLSLTLPESYFDLRFLAGKTAEVDRLLFFMFLLLGAIYWLIFLRGRLILARRQTMPPVGGNAGTVPYVLTGRKADLALLVVQWAALGYLTINRTKSGRIFLLRQIEMGNERKSFEVEIFRSLFRRQDNCDVRSGEYVDAKQTAAEKIRNYYRPRVFSAHGGSPAVLRAIGVLAGLALCLRSLDVVTAPQSWRWFVIAPLTLLGGLCCLPVQLLPGCALRRHTVRSAVLGLLGAVCLLVIARLNGDTRLMLLCLAAQLLIGLSLRLGGRRTRSGRSLAAELLGFRRYLLSTPSENMQSNLESDPQYFYRILPYADALRVGKIFAGAFERTRLEPCDWLIWHGKTPKTAPAFYMRYLRLMAGLRGERPPRARRRRPR